MKSQWISASFNENYHKLYCSTRDDRNYGLKRAYSLVLHIHCQIISLCAWQYAMLALKPLAFTNNTYTIHVIVSISLHQCMYTHTFIYIHMYIWYMRMYMQAIATNAINQSGYAVQVQENEIIKTNSDNTHSAACIRMAWVATTIRVSRSQCSRWCCRCCCCSCFCSLSHNSISVAAAAIQLTAVHLN